MPFWFNGIITFVLQAELEKRRAENQDNRLDEQPLETIVELRTEPDDKPDSHSEVENQTEETSDSPERPAISTETTETDPDQYEGGANEPENAPNEPANAENAI